MKKTLCAIVAYLILGLPLIAAADTITVRADSWPPYNDDATAAKPGYMIEVLKAIFEPKGHTVVYQNAPWKRALADALSGSATAVIGCSPDEAKGLVFPEQPFGATELAFYVKKGSPWKFDGPASLDSVKLGAIEGYAYTDELDEYIEKNKSSGKIHLATGDDALPKLTKMLAAGRIDTVIENPNVMNFMLLRDAATAASIEKASSLPDPDSLYVAFTPANPASKDYAKIFDEGIQELRKSGALKTILDSYGVQDWAK